MSKVLGLDIGSNSIGFSLLEVSEKDKKIIFEDLASNSIIFTEPTSAEDRRRARSSRRKNERKSARNKKARTIFVKYNIAKQDFINNTTNYLNNLKKSKMDVYELREKAVQGVLLSKDEFLFSVYSILTDRGYNNMFSQSSEDGVVNDAVSKNEKEYKDKRYAIPSMVITARKKKLEKIYQNVPIRNKKDDYQNSLDRAMHIEEFKKVVVSQSKNKLIFDTEDKCQNFIKEMIDEDRVNTPFYQRFLKSFEGMVAYCSFYDVYNPKGSYKRAPISNIKNIELTLRQKIDNYEIIVEKTGEIKEIEEDKIEKIINFWIETPSSNEINSANIFKSAGFKNLKLNIPEKSSQVVLDITAHRHILNVLTKYNIDFRDKQNAFYNDILEELYYFKNSSLRALHIKRYIQKYNYSLDDSFVAELSILENMDRFASFSLKFINEVLKNIDEKKSFHDALKDLGYFSRYTKIPTYNYLPPLEPTNKDIVWLSRNIKEFKKEHLLYQPMVSPKVRKVISVLRKLINELMQKYGSIDEIRIEATRDMNSKSEQIRISKNQQKDKKRNDDAIRFLKANNIKKTEKNIQRAKLYIEQEKDVCLCLYSGEKIMLDEAFNEEETEIEHFIPRSVVWINSYKNKILVKKKYNQDKGSQNPIAYLKSIGQWENFKGRVKDTFMASNKKDWLTNENIIKNVMQNEFWQDSYLNDTRSAVKIIQKYLTHYLYPKENLFGRNEKRHIFSVSGRAISELKYMWGIHTVMPKDKDGKKDRDTNYHHTLDAFTVALCSNVAIYGLHNFFIKRENRYKIRFLKESLTSNLPHSIDGKNIVQHLKHIVENYEEGKLYVCPFNKRKTNIRGFEDSNLKLYIAKDKNNHDILAEMEKIVIDSSILFKIVNGFPKNRSDNEVKKYVESLQKRLDKQKQKKIIDALGFYIKKLLEIRNELKLLESDIFLLKKTIKKGEKHKEFNNPINEKIKSLVEQKNNLTKELKELRCSFCVKGGKKQIVRYLRLHKTKIAETKADAIIFPCRKKRKIERLSLCNFKKALENKEPFSAKANGLTLSVKLFGTLEGQKVGLDYFSGIANGHIDTKVNPKYRELVKSSKDIITLYKNDIIKVDNIKSGIVEYFIFNGGGNIASTNTSANNKLSIKNININSFMKKDRKGNFKFVKEDTRTPSKTILVSKVKIDFFGSIIED